MKTKTIAANKTTRLDSSNLLVAIVDYNFRSVAFRARYYIHEDEVMGARRWKSAYEDFYSKYAGCPDLRT